MRCPERPVRALLASFSSSRSLWDIILIVPTPCNFVAFGAIVFAQHGAIDQFPRTHLFLRLSPAFPFPNASCTFQELASSTHQSFQVVTLDSFPSPDKSHTTLFKSWHLLLIRVFKLSHSTPFRHLTNRIPRLCSILERANSNCSTSKSPFDLEKHRARVASINHSPGDDGFTFSKREVFGSKGTNKGCSVLSLSSCAARAAQRARAAYLSHGGVVIVVVIIIVDVVEEHPPPAQDTNAQFADPLPR